MAKSTIEERIKRAVEGETPELLPQILAEIEKGNKGGVIATEHLELQNVDRKPSEGRGKSFRWLRRIGAIAAAFALLWGLGFAYIYYTPEVVISLDVNPSIELQVNRGQKVLEAKALNGEAEAILDGMNLKNTDLNVAVNAIIGSMVKNGYISELGNAILISVDSSDAAEGQRLQEELLAEVNQALHAYAVEGAVLSQLVSEDQQLSELAEEYGITLGKAALINGLIGEDGSLSFDSLAALSVNDICLLMDDREGEPQNLEVSGHVNGGGYISEGEARDIVLTQAGVEEDSLTSLKIKLDIQDGRMVYEIEFESATVEGEYVLDASSGDILEMEKEEKKAEEEKESEDEAESGHGNKNHGEAAGGHGGGHMNNR